MPNRWFALILAGCFSLLFFLHGEKRKREWRRGMHFVDAVLAPLPTIFRNVTSVTWPRHGRIGLRIFVQGATCISRQRCHNCRPIPLENNAAHAETAKVRTLGLARDSNAIVNRKIA